MKNIKPQILTELIFSIGRIGRIDLILTRAPGNRLCKLEILEEGESRAHCKALLPEDFHKLLVLMQEPSVWCKDSGPTIAGKH